MLGNALWGMAGAVWLLGAALLFIEDVLLPALGGGLNSGCVVGLGALPFFAAPLPCATLSAISLLAGYSLLAAFFISGWYISLEASLRSNDGTGSGRCWEHCCTADVCQSSVCCQGSCQVDMKAWAIVFQGAVLILEALATLALPFNLSSLTAWFIFVAAHLLGARFFVMVDAQEKMISQMSY